MGPPVPLANPGKPVFSLGEPIENISYPQVTNKLSTGYPQVIHRLTKEAPGEGVDMC